MLRCRPPSRFNHASLRSIAIAVSGWPQAVETFTFDRYEDMLRRQALTLSLYPVVEVTEVLSAGTGATDYSFDPVSGRLWMAHGYCWVDTVEVSYSRRL